MPGKIFVMNKLSKHRYVFTKLPILSSNESPLLRIHPLHVIHARLLNEALVLATIRRHARRVSSLQALRILLRNLQFGRQARAQNLRDNLRPLPGSAGVAGQGVEVLPAHDAANLAVLLVERDDGVVEIGRGDPAAAISRGGQLSGDDNVRRVAGVDNVDVVVGRFHGAEAAVELRVVPVDVGALVRLEDVVVEAREVGAVLQSGRDGGQGDEEVWSKVGPQAGDEAVDAVPAKGLLDVEVHAVEPKVDDQVV